MLLSAMFHLLLISRRCVGDTQGQQFKWWTSGLGSAKRLFWSSWCLYSTAHALQSLSQFPSSFRLDSICLRFNVVKRNMWVYCLFDRKKYSFCIWVKKTAAVARSERENNLTKWAWPQRLGTLLTSKQRYLYIWLSRLVAFLFFCVL